MLRLGLALLSLLLLGLLGVWLLARPSVASDAGARVDGRLAPSFALPDPDGRRVALSDFRGRPVVVNFWATWCVPCRKEMPDLDAAALTHRERGLVIVAINVQEEPSQVRAFFEDLSLRHLIPVLDFNAKTVTSYEVFVLPTTYFIDRAGVIRNVHRGQLDADALAQRLNLIL